MTRPIEPESAHEHQGLEGAVVAAPVHCCGCTYDLRGLSAESRCPECGLDIYITLQRLVDPTAANMPKLADPIGVGNAMLWLTICSFTALLLLCVQTVGVWLELVHPRHVGAWGYAAAHDSTLFAATIGLLAMWSVFKFKPPRKQPAAIAVRLDVWTLGIGIAIWSILTLALWQRERHWSFAAVDEDDVVVIRALLHILMALAGVLIWIGMRRVLRTIGIRSRAYRRAHGGRQRIRPMIAATLGIVLGSAIRLLDVYQVSEGLELLGSILIWVSMLMLLIGAGYLAINAVWIRHALRNPPPRLGDLLIIQQ